MVDPGDIRVHRRGTEDERRQVRQEGAAPAAEGRRARARGRGAGASEGLMAAKLAWLSYTPVKGLQLLQVDEAEVTERGIPGDRRFHLIDERGRLTNSKRGGALQQVRASWDEDAGRLALHFPDGSVVEDEVRTTGERVETNFYGRPVEGAVVAEPFESALSAFAGSSLRLVQSLEPGVGIDRGREGSVTL